MLLYWILHSRYCVRGGVQFSVWRCSSPAHHLVQGQHRAAIQHLLRVLEISKEMSDTVGDADAYGTIADIYTEMGNFDTAAQFYDKYIERMENDGPV